MAKIVLTNAEVAAKYEATVEKDLIIHARGYSGKLSGINMSGADHCYTSKTGYLVLKNAPSAAAATDKNSKTSPGTA